MSTIEILNVVRQALTIAATLLIVLSILFAIFYFIVYKKRMHGTKKISPKQFLLLAIGITYIVGIFCVTLMNRLSGLDGGINLRLFAAYRVAWRSYVQNPWRDIILNIIMLVPLGMLLPICFRKCRKFLVTFMFGFCFSLIIETTQFITRRGIFETDDLWGNTSGALIGYGLIMLLWSGYAFLKRKPKILPVWKLVLAQIPMIFYVIFFVYVSYAHSMHEFGNLDVRYSTRQDMQQVKLQLNTEFTNAQLEAEVYQTITGNKEDTMQYARKVMQDVGTDVDESKTQYHKTEAVYTSLDGKCQVTVKYIGLASHITYGANEEISPKSGCDKETLCNALQKIGFELPETVTFREEDAGAYYLGVDLYRENDSLYDGEIRCEYDKEEKIKVVDDTIFQVQEVKKYPIISDLVAYMQLKKGYFRLDGVSEMNEIAVNGVSLDYCIDSKGFFQPVYFFYVQIDGEDNVIKIPALK